MPSGTVDWLIAITVLNPTATAGPAASPTGPLFHHIFADNFKDILLLCVVEALSNGIHAFTATTAAGNIRACFLEGSKCGLSRTIQARPIDEPNKYNDKQKE
jgi:hypothetical protein